MKNILFTLFVLFGAFASAQSTPKHPRALEIERNMQKDVQVMLHDLLLNRPFQVSVQVYPLHRGQAQVSGSKESLPYYDADDEVRDEWDDPAKTEFELLGRVQRISVSVTVPDDLGKDDLETIKASVKSFIPFVEGRDNVEVSQKTFKGPVDGETQRLNTIAFLAICASVLVLGAMTMLSGRALGKAIRNIKVSGGEASAGGAMAALPPMPVDNAIRGGGGGVSSLNGADIQFHDTLKMIEITTGVLKTVYSSTIFPCLEDMVLFEEFSEKASPSTGALFAELPSRIRERVFALTYSTHWLETLTQPGKMDSSSFMLLSRLARVDRESKNPQWEQLLVACWRLNDRLGDVLKKWKEDDAVAVLRALPQSFAVKVAREILPGGWAVIFKSAAETPLAPAVIDGYLKQINEKFPLRSIEVLGRYKKDVELARYLRTADPIVEKEVYGALPANSSLRDLRSPFYTVLEAGPEVLKPFTETVALEDWALAFMNISKTERMKIEAFFSDRQNFRFRELLKAYDRVAPSQDSVGIARERIANRFRALEKQSAFQPAGEENSSTKKAA